tara:strand:+ start:560 stop:736 length:177 start_codon:yes stop_codon:yes gene_type:complete
MTTTRSGLTTTRLELKSKNTKSKISNNDKYDVNIDFNESHKEWMKNKIKLPYGNYKYK